jgi:hypothetical protein
MIAAAEHDALDPQVISWAQQFLALPEEERAPAILRFVQNCIRYERDPAWFDEAGVRHGIELLDSAATGFFRGYLPRVPGRERLSSRPGGGAPDRRGSLRPGRLGGCGSHDRQLVHRALAEGESAHGLARWRAAGSRGVGEWRAVREYLGATVLSLALEEGAVAMAPGSRRRATARLS